VGNLEEWGVGIQYEVAFSGEVPKVEAVKAALAERDIQLQMRMVDGALAAPAELPPENWSEIRVAIAKNMLTVRRHENTIAVVAWGNADGAMADAWRAITWAFAAAGSGLVKSEEGIQTADQFAASHPF
jgi:hypothetical protein